MKSINVLAVSLLSLIGLAACKKNTVSGNPQGSAVCTACQLTKIQYSDTGSSVRISYTSQGSPSKIQYYSGSRLQYYYSCLYGADKRLDTVLKYEADPDTTKPFHFTKYARVDWDAYGNLIKKTVYDAKTGTVSIADLYQYDGTGRLQQTTTVLNGTELLSRLEYENGNIKKVSLFSGNKLISSQQGIGYDTCHSYLTHPLLWYLLDVDQLHYSRNNPMAIKTTVYEYLPGRTDSVSSTSNISYLYNDKRLPAQATIVETGGVEYISSTIRYEYGNQ